MNPELLKQMQSNDGTNNLESQQAEQEKVSNSNDDQSGPERSHGGTGYETQQGDPLFSLSMGGVLNPLFSTSTGEYSDFLIKIKEKLDVVAKEYIHKRNIDMKFHFIDKNNPQTATAGSIVAATLKDGDKKKIYYYFFLLGCTCKEAMTSGELLTTFENNMKLMNQQVNNMAFRQNIDMSYRTLDVYVDDNLHKIMIKEIANDYNLNPNEVEWVHVGGSITSPLLTISQVDECVDIIYKTAMSTILTDKFIFHDKVQRDLDVQSGILMGSKDYNLTITVKNNPTNNKNDPVNGNRDVIRQDFRVELNATKRLDAGRETSYNKIDTDQIICSASGYVSALPCTQDMMDPRNPAYKVQVARLSPHIIFTDTHAPIATLRFKLLSLAVGCNMLDRENYITALYNNVGTKNDPGFLNYITNIYNCDKPQDIQPLDFKSKKPQEIYNDLNAMFTGHPVISLDILPFTAQSHVDKTFVIAAIGRDYNERMMAIEDIIQSACELTNGHFNKSFPMDKVFACGAIPFPAGYASIQNVVKDTRNVDLAFVCSHIRNDQEKLHTFLRSEIAHNLDYDPFMGKIKTFNNIGMRDAHITGRGTRITFHAEFISELVRAVNAAGLNPTFTKPRTFEQSDFSFQGYNAFFQNATINPGFAFGTPMAAQGFNPGMFSIVSPFGSGFAR